MSDLLISGLVAAMMLVPFIALWWLYRRYLKARARKMAEQKSRSERLASPASGAPTPSVVPALDDPAAAVTSARFSFPIGVPLVIYPLLLWGLALAGGRWWGWLLQGIYLFLLGLFTWEALSRKEYEKIREKDPGLNRATWILNWLLFFVVLPAAAWIAAMMTAR